MKREDALKLSDKALANLAESLQAGKSETLTNYLAMLARFHRYSFGNIMMIYLQKPEAMHVAGYTTWATADKADKMGHKTLEALLNSNDSHANGHFVPASPEPYVQFPEGEGSC